MGRVLGRRRQRSAAGAAQVGHPASCTLPAPGTAPGGADAAPDLGCTPTSEPRGQAAWPPCGPGAFPSPLLPPPRAFFSPPPPCLPPAAAAAPPPRTLPAAASPAAVAPAATVLLAGQAARSSGRRATSPRAAQGGAPRPGHAPHSLLPRPGPPPAPGGGPAPAGAADGPGLALAPAWRPLAREQQGLWGHWHLRQRWPLPCAVGLTGAPVQAAGRGRAVSRSPAPPARGPPLQAPPHCTCLPQVPGCWAGPGAGCTGAAASPPVRGSPASAARCARPCA